MADLDNVPTKLYDDVRPGVKALADTASLIPRYIKTLFSGFDRYITGRELDAAEEMREYVTRKLSGIQKDEIVPPELYVAIPAIKAAAYSMDNVDLKKCYANLLSSSMVKKTKYNVHPSFVEIIKQLSPLDAQILKKCEDSMLSVNIRCQRKAGQGFLQSNPELSDMIDVMLPRYGSDLYSNFVLFSGLEDLDVDNISFCVQNLLRLGLLNVEEFSFANKNDPQYIKISNCNAVKKVFELVQSQIAPNIECVLIPRRIVKTEFCRKILSVCLD